MRYLADIALTESADIVLSATVHAAKPRLFFTPQTLP